MNSPTLPTFVLSDPLAMHAPSLAAFVHRWHTAQSMLIARGAQFFDLEDFCSVRKPYSVTPDGVATIHIHEVLSWDGTKLGRMLGTSYGDLISELRAASEDDAVRGILLDVSSPGGSAVGAPEAAAAVVEARQAKPVVAYVESIGASAAYYAIAGASAIVAGQSAVVGSVGTIAMFPDFSAMLSSAGIAINIMTPSASDLKAAGNQFRAMRDNEREFLQGRIERMNADFIAWIAEHRPAVPADAMRGQWFSGKEAADIGLADQVGDMKSARAALDSLA